MVRQGEKAVVGANGVKQICERATDLPHLRMPVMILMKREGSLPSRRIAGGRDEPTLPSTYSHKVPNGKCSRIPCLPAK